MWHQLLDKPDSYQESSGDRYVYVYRSQGGERGLDQSPLYYHSPRTAGRGLAAKVTATGRWQDICIGTSIEDDIRYIITAPPLPTTHTGSALS